ncbi:hypothetical protein GH714_038768 [Hevea brasiliensis]|uniref:DUF4378 domain-containing protein n=1 Tax=Hevea brasiliensis TaxID=3981 RepID=A0A6A6MSZ0_HEVBR|nr:hypothetical protein GH714_038768 [Hevea brasiliensis]
MPISRSTANLLRKWNSVSVPDHKCQINEELEHRIGMVETSLNKFGMILGSVQSDVMQVNKGTKEVSLEMEGMRQKLIVLDTSLQQMVTALSTFLIVSESMNVNLFLLDITEATTCSLKTSSQNSLSITVLPPKVTGSYTTPQRKPEPLRNPAMPPKPCGQATLCPKIEMGAWNTVRPEQATFTQMASHMEQKSKRVSSFQKSIVQEKQCVIIESDEEIDGVFSCLIDDKKTAAGNAKNKPFLLTNLDQNSQRIIGGEESVAAVAASKPSVKKLMEEEMFCEKDLKKEINSVEMETKQSTSESGGNKRKNRKRTSRSRSRSCEIYIEDLDAAENLEPEKPCLQNSEKQSNNILDMDDLMEEFCRQIHHTSCLTHDQHDEVHSQPNWKNSDFEEKLSEAIKIFISQRLINGKHVTGDEEIFPSKELKDALRILSSDEELSLKLLQGPKSVMVKYVENLWNAHIGKDNVSKPLSGSNLSGQEIHGLKQSDEVIHGKQRKFFRRKAKSLEKNQSKEIKPSQASNRIVILKPGPIGVQKPETEGRVGSSPESQITIRNKGPNERVGSYFFFTEIKRRPPTGVKKEEKNDKLKECETGLKHEAATYPKERLSNIYVQAKKHLSEMLPTGIGDVDFSSTQVPRTLGRILSLPEYNFSPIGSPGRDWEQSLVTAQMRFSANENFQKQENNVDHLGRMTLNSETELCISYDSDVDIVKVAEIVVQEDGNILDTLSEPSDSSRTRDDQNGDMSEVCDEKRHSVCLEHDLLEQNQASSSAITSPSTSTITKKDDNLEGIVEALERPSPVSVLEPLFIEEEISPARTRFQPAELRIQPQRIHFEEHVPSAADIGTHLKAYIADKESIFEYVKAVLQASGENWDEFYIMSNSCDPLLDPSIFDEVWSFPNQLSYDRKLIFDCINEVLMEVYGRYFGCPLGLSFAKPTIRPAPDMENAIREVWEGVYWYLLPLPLPRTLEQIVKKDMAKTGTWMDLRYDSETIIIEIGEAIFKDLVEETTLSCVNECSESGNPSIAAESKDQSSIDL